MQPVATKDVEETLGKSDVHDKWEDAYRTAANEQYYEMAFDRLKQDLERHSGGLILDAGCGIGVHSARLAERGFRTVAIDVSDIVVSNAVDYLRERGVLDRVEVRKDNLLSLSFSDRTFDVVLLWGVLMHVPDIEAALSEIDRVLKVGGSIVIYEGNLNSIDATLYRVMRPFRKSSGVSFRKTPSGIESWQTTSTGRLMTRMTRMSWLVGHLEEMGYRLESRTAGQFTELYTAFSTPWIQRFCHRLNHFWFRVVKTPVLAFGNLVIVEKTASAETNTN